MPSEPWIRALLVALTGTTIALTSACGSESPESDTPEPAAESASASDGDTTAMAAEPAPAPVADPEPVEREYDGGFYEGERRYGSTEVPEKAAGTLRLVTYNVLNYFDADDDPAIEGDVDDWHSKRRGLRAKPAPQLEAVADAILAVDADIVALQEIESEAALAAFRDDYLADAGFDYIASIDVGYSRGVEQSVLSRFPIVDTQVWPGMMLEGNHPSDPEQLGRWDQDLAGQPMDFRRSPLLVRVSVPDPDGGADYELTLINVHHKSGRMSGYWRTAEAQAVAGIIRDIEAQNPDANIAALGDFNTTPDTAPYDIYVEDLGMTDVLADERTRGREWMTHASGRAIDHIMVNDALLPEVVRGSGFVYATPVRLQGMDYRSTPEPEGFASDHMPVAIDIRIGDEE